MANTLMQNLNNSIDLTTNFNTNINLNGIDICININHQLLNEMDDTNISLLLAEITEIKNTIIKLINNIQSDDKYNLRNRTISTKNIECIKSNIINSYISYQNKLLEYYVRLNYLKSNCIRNNDHLVDWYNKTKKILNVLTIEHDNLKLNYEKANIDFIETQNKLNSHCIEQSIKVEVLNSELSDVKNQRDFLKGLNCKNKEVINNLDKELKFKINELEAVNIEKIKNNHEIHNYSYEIDKILNDRKIIIDKNLTLCEQFNELKNDFEKTISLLNTHKLKTEKMELENDKLEKYIFKQNSEHIKNLCQMNELMQNKQNEKIKILGQLSDLLPNYTWDDKYGFISIEYEVINADNT